MKLSDADHALVTEAVTRAELSSDGEIVPVVTDRSDSYHDVALHYAVLAMLLVPAILAFVPYDTMRSVLRPFMGWSQELDTGAAMLLLFALLILAFLVVRLVLAWTPLRMALTPSATKSRRVRRQAIAMFKVAAERRTVGRTGVLLYVSMLEHRAEIVADHAIHSKVEPEIWGDAMAVLVENLKAGRPGEGMAAAVEQIGIVLAACLPRTLESTNEIPDKLIEI